MAAFTVAEYLATRLRDIGVQHVFTVPGDYCAPFLEAIKRAVTDGHGSISTTRDRGQVTYPPISLCFALQTADLPTAM
jgi:hypothetical protein